MNTILWISLSIIVVFGFLKRDILFKKLSGNQVNNQNSPEIDTNDILSTDELKEKFEDLGLGKHWDKFKPLLRNEIRIITSKSDTENKKTGISKIGGQPDLPKDIQWFKENNGKSLSFIAQININEVKVLDIDNLLPDSGMLYFFYSAEQEAWGFDPKDFDKFKVYYSSETENLERKEYPGDLPDYSRFKICNIDFVKTVGLPSWDNDFVRKNLSENEVDQYFNLPQNYTIHKLLGYANVIQSEMELECQLVTNGLYCGGPSGYNDPKAKELENGAKDWILLLQIDSEEEKTGMMWGDVGRLYFWIKRDDLKNKDFNKSWMISQCS